MHTGCLHEQQFYIRKLIYVFNSSIYLTSPTGALFSMVEHTYAIFVSIFVVSFFIVMPGFKRNNSGMHIGM